MTPGAAGSGNTGVNTGSQVTVQAFGGQEQLVPGPTAVPAPPGPDQVLVQVEAAGVNYLDVLQRKGLGNVSLPFCPGFEGVGRVREAGPGAALVAGQRVAWINAPGSYATQVTLPAELAVPVPDSFTPGQAMLFQAVTAQYLVTEYRDVRPGDWVLVHAAAGGVGQLLVQWLKHLGAWVVGTGSSDAKVAAIWAAGADAAIDYGHDYTFLDQLMASTGGRGVDLAFDAVGAGTFANTLGALARGGTAVCYGAASGPAAPVPPQELIPRSLRIAGGNLFSYIADPAEFQRRARAVVEGIQEGWLSMPDVTEYKLDQAAEAHRALEGRGTTGKLVLVP